MTEDFAAAFAIKKSEDDLAWFRAVCIAPRSLHYLKDGSIDLKLENMYWDQEARYHQPILINLVDLWMILNFFNLICDLHPLYYKVMTPKVIKMRSFDESATVWFVVSMRTIIFLILLYAKMSKFFVGSDCAYLKSKWKVLIGMIAIQVVEMLLSIWCVDKDPGMHCILLLVIFNFTPTRLVEKAPVCIAVYVVWSLSFFAYCFTWEEGERYKELWGYPKEVRPPESWKTKQ